MLANGTDPFAPRPAPKPGMMYNRAPAQQPQGQQPAQQTQSPAPKSSGVDMSSYKPGQAQPVQQSQGTPYGRYAPGTDLTKEQYTDTMQPNPAYRPQQGAGTGPGGRPVVYQNGVAGYMDFGTAGRVPPGMFGTHGGPGFTPLPQGGGQPYRGDITPQAAEAGAPDNPWIAQMQGNRPPSTQVTGDWQGGYAGMAPGQRPPAYQAGPAQTPWGQSMDPAVERDAMIKQINEQRMQRQVAFNNNSPAPPSTWGAEMPSLDYQRAMQGAGLAGGAPSMAPDYGDSLIGRLNEQFGGGQYQPQYGQSMLAPPKPTYQPPPGYGTPPEKRGQAKQFQAWVDKDGDGTDDRDQDGPGMTQYGRAQAGSPWAPGAGPAPQRPSPDAYRDPNRAYYMPAVQREPRMHDSNGDGVDDRLEGILTLPAVDRGIRHWSDPANPTNGPSAPSRPGTAQPVQPPSQGNAYGESVTDLKSLPFYKSLMIGDTVRKRANGQYDVIDSSGKAVQTYGNESQGYRLAVQSGKGRTGQTMWGATAEGSAEQAATLKRVQEQDRIRNDAEQKEAAPKIARLAELRAKQMAWARSGNRSKGLVKDASGNYNTPWFDEYQSLMKWASPLANGGGNLSPQQKDSISWLAGDKTNDQRLKSLGTGKYAPAPVKYDRWGRIVGRERQGH